MVQEFRNRLGYGYGARTNQRGSVSPNRLRPLHGEVYGANTSIDGLTPAQPIAVATGGHQVRTIRRQQHRPPAVSLLQEQGRQRFLYPARGRLVARAASDRCPGMVPSLRYQLLQRKHRRIRTLTATAQQAHRRWGKADGDDCSDSSNRLVWSPRGLAPRSSSWNNRYSYFSPGRSIHAVQINGASVWRSG